MNRRINLLADKFIPLESIRFPDPVSVTNFDPAAGLPGDLDRFDALFIRTVNPIDKSTLPDAPKRLRLICSATAGFDHVDLDWLKTLKIQFEHAPGCNARAVGEYVSVALLNWALGNKIELSSLQAGIVGCGNTGSAVASLFDKLGIEYVCHDPPREERDSAFRGVGLDEVLKCDLLTFHTPLTRTGDWPTFHWLNRNRLKQKSFQLVINTSRGSVVDEQALLEAYRKGSVGAYILDVWENEPLFSDRVAKNAFIKTPHIAGYSAQSKLRGSRIIAEKFCDSFQLPAPTLSAFQDSADHKPEPHELKSAGSTQPNSGQTSSGPAADDSNRSGSDTRPATNSGTDDFLNLVNSLNPILDYSSEFEKMIGLKENQKAAAFGRLRTETPLRQEHARHRLDPKLIRQFPLLSPLGFRSK